MVRVPLLHCSEKKGFLPLSKSSKTLIIRALFTVATKPTMNLCMKGWILEFLSRIGGFLYKKNNGL